MCTTSKPPPPHLAGCQTENTDTRRVFIGRILYEKYFSQKLNEIYIKMSKEYYQ